jgi:hypothetical protein
MDTFSPKIMSSTTELDTTEAESPKPKKAVFGEISLEKFSRRKNLGEEAIRQRITTAISILREHDLPVTGANIKKLGIGASTYTKYKPDKKLLDPRTAKKGKGAKGKVAKKEVAVSANDGEEESEEEQEPVKKKKKRKKPVKEKKEKKKRKETRFDVGPSSPARLPLNGELPEIDLDNLPLFPMAPPLLKREATARDLYAHPRR